MNKMQLLNMVGDLVSHAQESGIYLQTDAAYEWREKYDELSHALFDAIATSNLTEGAYDVPVYACRHWNDEKNAYDLEVFETLTDNLVDVVDIEGIIAQREWCEDRFIQFYDE